MCVCGVQYHSVAEQRPKIGVWPKHMRNGGVILCWSTAHVTNNHHIVHPQIGTH
jgi:hypothetical protein